MSFEFETDIQGLPVTVEYDYQPEEPTVIHPVDSVDPGCSAQADVLTVTVKADGKCYDVIHHLNDHAIGMLEEAAIAHHGE